MMNAYHLFQEYIQLQHKIDEFYHELAVRQGLSDSALLVLWSLEDLGEGCTQTGICRQFALTKQTVHSSVQKLSKDGLLSLRPGPGREVRVYPTEAGRALIREKVIPLKKAEEAASQRMGEAELASMLRLTQTWFSLFQEEAASILKNPKQ
ncbi:MAG: MarR family winged helix-turn-helix transcriptional regulator [Dysosmobacter sp.]|nr:MarR family winged helix-turn-helix transcriptional regulator [Dysosmobacter sp.]